MRGRVILHIDKLIALELQELVHLPHRIDLIGAQDLVKVNTFEIPKRCGILHGFLLVTVDPGYLISKVSIKLSPVHHDNGIT
jgi:hypothetical protein